MKVTVQLEQAEIMEAIEDYLTKIGYPEQFLGTAKMKFSVFSQEIGWKSTIVLDGLSNERKLVKVDIEVEEMKTFSEGPFR